MPRHVIWETGLTRCIGVGFVMGIAVAHTITHWLHELGWWEYGHPLESTTPGKRFASDFRKIYGTDMLAYAPFAYDAAGLTIKAVEQANSAKPQVFNAAIKSIDYEHIVCYLFRYSK